MARGQTIVDTSRLTAAAQKVEGLAGEYEGEYGRLFETVHDMKAVYDSADSEAFINQIEGFRNDFEKMTQLMREYASFLKKTATDYETRSQQLANEAKRLNQGS